MAPSSSSQPERESNDSPQSDERAANSACAQTERSISELMDNARMLAKHAVETGQVPKGVDVERMFAIRRRFELDGEISERELSSFLSYYQLLERSMSPVTVDTLRATEWNQEKPCAASSYVTKLWLRTYLNIAVNLVCHLVLFMAAHPDGKWFRTNMFGASVLFMVHYLIPFLYGALGADAFLIRETTHQLRTREFDPRRIPENAARFLLGTLSGGVIILFVNPEVMDWLSPQANGTAQSPALDARQVGSAALGFIAGYSNDFLFSVIERVIRSITLRDDRDEGQRAARLRQTEALLERFETAVKQSTASPEEGDRVAWSRSPKPEAETPEAPRPRSAIEQLKSLP